MAALKEYCSILAGKKKLDLIVKSLGKLNTLLVVPLRND
jgi:hypothetical protein